MSLHPAGAKQKLEIVAGAFPSVARCLAEMKKGLAAAGVSIHEVDGADLGARAILGRVVEDLENVFYVGSILDQLPPDSATVLHDRLQTLLDRLEKLGNCICREGER